jgi:hypothetical protein
MGVIGSLGHKSSLYIQEVCQSQRIGWVRAQLAGRWHSTRQVTLDCPEQC